MTSPFVTGERLTATRLNGLLDRDNGILPAGVLARGRRITSSGAIAGTEIGLLRLDNIPVYAGRLYRISTNGLNLDSDTANTDILAARIRVNTSGVATTSSTIVGFMRNWIDNQNQSNVTPLNVYYMPSADGTASFLLSAIRQAGAGIDILFASAAEPCDLVVVDEGLDPGDTGVVI